MLGNQMRATIVVTSYNLPKSLQLSTRSAMNQSYDDLEIIVADDNSSDPRMPAVLERLSKEPNVTVFQSAVTDEERAHKARYATMINAAVREYSMGDYLFFLPDDDIFLHNKVLRHVAAMEANKWDVSYSSQAIFRRGEHVSNRIANEVLTVGYNVVDHGQVCVTRNAFDAVNGWPDDAKYWSGADAYFWNRLTDAGYLFHPINEVLCIKNERDGVQNKVFSGRKPWE